MESEVDIRRGLEIIQSMIDISADRLEGLRTQCVTSAELTQQEIRTLETKLVKMFTEMLLTKARLPERLPKGIAPTSAAELKQWLRVVGLSQTTLNTVLQRVSSLEVLLEKSEAELKALLPAPLAHLHHPSNGHSGGGSYDEEEARRLVRAMNSLRQYRHTMMGKAQKTTLPPLDDRLELFWDSWDSRQTNAPHHHHHHHHSKLSGTSGASPRTTRSHHQHHYQQTQLAKASTTAANAVGGGTVDGNNSGIQSPIEVSPPESYNNSQSSTSAAIQSPAEESSTMSTNLTPSPSPPMSPSSLSGRSGGNGGGGGGGAVAGRNANPAAADKFPSTPPTRVKHQTSTMTSNSPLECGTPTTLAVAGQHQWPHTTAGSNNNHNNTAQQVIMTKSKSHESQLINNETTTTGQAQTPSDNAPSSNNNNNGGGGVANGGMKTPRSRLHTEPGPDHGNDLLPANEKHTNIYQNNNLTVPRSPLTPTTTTGGGGGNQMATLNHDIPHHFTKNFKLTTVTCNFCNRQMFYGLKCKECKYRCHKECEPQVPPSCGLPQQVFDMINSSPNMNRTVSGGGAGMLLGSGGVGGHHHSRRANQELIGVGGHGKAGGGGGHANLTMASGDGRPGGGGGGGPDSSSAGSSCNSSSPSSPALLLSSSSSHTYYGSHYQHHPQTPQQGATGYVGHHKSQFSFPEVAAVVNAEETTLYKNSEMVNSNISVLSDYRPPNSPRITFTADEGPASGSDGGGDATGSIGPSFYNGMEEALQSPLVSGGGSGGYSNTNNSGGGASASNAAGDHGGSGHHNYSSAGGGGSSSGEMTLEEKTASTMSGSSTNTGGSSTDSERTPVRLDSTEERDSLPWPRQNSLSLKEWDIPYDDLRLLEQLGKGRFGTVHRALWHGDVAVKLLKEDYLDDERTLEAFKLEVAIFKKTRHENVVLFMGACMKPPRLAIVTSLCKGKTLYTYIHQCRDKFNLNKATLVAQQISQGMGYLHARGIVHKDLKTKNIFLENGKVIITDFGLFSATKLLYCHRGVEVQENWLCYLGPELIRGLKPVRPTDEDLPFSRASDVYAFGTVWYELLCGEFPYRKVPAESVIWQVGRGMKPTLANLQASRDVKDILMVCWAFQADDRKDFATLLSLLERLPKKRLARSPSHPVQLSKSAESVF